MSCAFVAACRAWTAQPPMVPLCRTVPPWHPNRAPAGLGQDACLDRYGRQGPYLWGVFLLLFDDGKECGARIRCTNNYYKDD